MLGVVIELHYLNLFLVLASSLVAGIWGLILFFMKKTATIYRPWRILLIVTAADALLQGLFGVTLVLLGQKPGTGTDLYYLHYVYGGIVDLPLTANQLQAVQTAALAINAPGKVAGTTLQATESTYRVYADQRNVYLEDYPNGLSITLQVRYLGGPVPKATEIDLQAAAPAVYDEPQYWDFLDFPASLTINPGQLAISFPVTVKAGSAAQAGFVALTCTANGLPSSGYFTSFRKYAQTDFGIPAGTHITWELMYPNVLRFHYLAFPAMSRYIPLNQPDAVMGAKNPILARTSDAYKGTTLFMPVVRSMSPCQRALLRAYLTGEPWQPPQ